MPFTQALYYDLPGWKVVVNPCRNQNYRKYFEMRKKYGIKPAFYLRGPMTTKDHDHGDHHHHNEKEHGKSHSHTEHEHHRHHEPHHEEPRRHEPVAPPPQNNPPGPNQPPQPPHRRVG
jgi:hypothetical protein